VDIYLLLSLGIARPRREERTSSELVIDSSQNGFRMVAAVAAKLVLSPCMAPAGGAPRPQHSPLQGLLRAVPLLSLWI
jgi:hypothetical protein